MALSVLSLTYLTLLEFNVFFSYSVLGFVFFASITGYNFVKFFGIARFHHRSLENWLKVVQLFSLCCFVLMCYFGWQLRLKTLLCLVGFGGVTFLYAIPFLPKYLVCNNKYNLRNIGGLKIYLIGLVWSGVTVLIPLIECNYPFNISIIITAIQRFVFIIVLMLPFEIRDLRYDNLMLSTIPQQIGVKWTKIIGSILLCLFFVLEFFKGKQDFIILGILFFITMLTLLFLVFSNIKQFKYYCAFWIEGIPILWLVLFLLLH